MQADFWLDDWFKVKAVQRYCERVITNTGALVKYSGGPVNITGAPLNFTGAPVNLAVHR